MIVLAAPEGRFSVFRIRIRTRINWLKPYRPSCLGRYSFFHFFFLYQKKKKNFKPIPSPHPYEYSRQEVINQTHADWRRARLRKEGGGLNKEGSRESKIKLTRADNLSDENRLNSLIKRRDSYKYIGTWVIFMLYYLPIRLSVNTH